MTACVLPVFASLITKRAVHAALAAILLAGPTTSCTPAAEDDTETPRDDAGEDEGGGDDARVGRAVGDSAATVERFDAGTRGASAAGASDASSTRRDGSLPASDASRGRSSPDGSSESVSDAGPAADADGGRVCELPTTFRWTGGAPFAQPKNGSVSMKDVSHAFYNGQHVLYFTTFQNNWGSGMMTFSDWSEAASAAQTPTSFGVAPTLFYFTPKKLWVLAYQWGPHKFSYRTSSDPTSATGWSAEKSLYNTALPPDGTGPIDQTIICDSSNCFLYYAGDNGHIYKSSMPVANFPAEFPAAKDSGIVGTAQNLFEAVQVYKLKGSQKYLMIVEAQGPARYFRAFTATDLDGPWTLLTNDFAVKKNVTLSVNWTNDISHGDIIRVNADETFTIDPCNVQLIFQGRDPSINTEYGRLPYRLGLLTLQR